MAKTLLLFVVNLANSPLLSAIYASIIKMLSHFSFATELCRGLIEIKVNMKTAVPLLFSSFAFSGCDDKSSQPKQYKPNKKLYLSLEEEEYLFYLQNPFDKEREVTITSKEGEKIRLVAYNCTVIKAVVKEGIVVKWVKLLNPNLFYLFSKCSRSTITLTKDNYVEVFLDKTGFGGGGCCAVSGTFCTKDGDNWEEIIKGKWKKYKAEE